ncbi:hypothetical protein M433DRAFT_413069 [Acidomyces richmondensis BFW]|nr:hypothetical protein M433DRAFT_413069 [Acidomyces richmondensis BFW]
MSIRQTCITCFQHPHSPPLHPDNRPKSHRCFVSYLRRLHPQHTLTAISSSNLPPLPLTGFGTPPLTTPMFDTKRNTTPPPLHPLPVSRGRMISGCDSIAVSPRTAPPPLCSLDTSTPTPAAEDLDAAIATSPHLLLSHECAVEGKLGRSDEVAGSREVFDGEWTWGLEGRMRTTDGAEEDMVCNVLVQVDHVLTPRASVWPPDCWGMFGSEDERKEDSVPMGHKCGKEVAVVMSSALPSASGRTNSDFGSPERPGLVVRGPVKSNSVPRRWSTLVPSFCSLMLRIFSADAFGSACGDGHTGVLRGYSVPSCAAAAVYRP